MFSDIFRLLCHFWSNEILEATGNTASVAKKTISLSRKKCLMTAVFQQTAAVSNMCEPNSQTLSNFSETFSNFWETLSNFWETFSNFRERLSNFWETFSNFRETFSNFWETFSNFWETLSNTWRMFSTGSCVRFLCHLPDFHMFKIGLFLILH